MALIGLALAIAGCSDGKSGGKPARRAVKFPVEVAAVEARAVEYSVRAVGTIDVFERVQVTARVAGVVDAVKFDVGDLVKVNQTLVSIDAARYNIAEREARAAAETARIAIADAEAGLARRQTADQANPGLIPGEELETWRNKVASAKANLAERQVARDRAGLDQRDAHVRAPIAGEIESRTVVTGAYVQAGTVLATMVRRDPLRLRFDVAAAEAAPLAKGATVRFTVDGDDRAYHAVIVHIAAAADATSRMVRITAEVDDPERAKVPAGGFAQVVVPIGGSATAAVVPETAIRPSERGFLTYVVEGEVARERVVELGMRTADGLVEIRKGLVPGDKLVVRGAEALRDGVAIRLGSPPGAKKPEAKKPEAKKPAEPAKTPGGGAGR